MNSLTTSVVTIVNIRHHIKGWLIVFTQAKPLGILIFPIGLTTGVDSHLKPVIGLSAVWMLGRPVWDGDRKEALQLRATATAASQT